jgi:hypothetical protein
MVSLRVFLAALGVVFGGIAAIENGADLSAFLEPLRRKR